MAGAIAATISLLIAASAAAAQPQNAYCQSSTGPRPGRIVIDSVNAHHIPGATTCPRASRVARAWLRRQHGTPPTGTTTDMRALGRDWSCLAGDEYLPYGRRGFASLRVECSPYAGPTTNDHSWVIIVAVVP